MNTLVIGFGSRARQGKDTCAAAILEACSYAGKKAKLYSISDEIKRFCVDKGYLPDIPRESMTSEQVGILISVSAAQHKEHGDGVWVEPLMARIVADNLAVAILPNLRIEYEARAVKQVGGVTVLVQRFNPDGSPYISPDRDPNHRLETSLRHWPWDYRLSGVTGDNYWLQKQARALYEHLRDTPKGV